MRLKICKMATHILLKLLTLELNISRTIWRIEVSDDSFFGLFHALSFELNFFRLEFPFKAENFMQIFGFYQELIGSSRMQIRERVQSSSSRTKTGLGTDL